ncbi:MAG: hypothetical protein ACYTFY_20945, partial [Planctomycetota bacterium]
MINYISAQSATVTASATDYIEARKEAMKLYKARKYAEAREAFIKMTEIKKVTDFQKSDALEQAVIASLSLKEYDKAAELAEQVPIEGMKKYCHLLILNSQNKAKEIVEKYKSENLKEWPSIIRANAYRMRGNAFYHAKMGKEAEADYKEALKFPLQGRDRSNIY